MAQAVNPVIGPTCIVHVESLNPSGEDGDSAMSLRTVMEMKLDVVTFYR